MESQIENSGDIHFSKLKYVDDSNINDLQDKFLNNDLNFINNNTFSHLGTTNLPTDFNNLTDLDCFDADFSLINNIRQMNNNFQFFKNKEKKYCLDNTFDNVNVNIIEENNYKRNFEDIFSEKPKKSDYTELDILSLNSYNQTFHKIPSSQIKNRNNLKSRSLINSLHKKQYLNNKSNKKNILPVNDQNLDENIDSNNLNLQKIFKDTEESCLDYNKYIFKEKPENLTSNRLKKIVRISDKNLKFSSANNNIKKLTNISTIKTNENIRGNDRERQENRNHSIDLNFFIDSKIEKDFMKITKKYIAIPIFYISKKHKRKCSHSRSKTQKDIIKHLAQEDYFHIINTFIDEKKINQSNMIPKNFKDFNNKININKINTKFKNECAKKLKKITFEKNIQESFTKINPNQYNSDKKETFMKKNTANRNFRLFDKDVVIKKIMSNFLKFLKLVLDNFLNDDNLKFLYDIDKSKLEEKFSNLNKCIEFLNLYKVSDFMIMKKSKDFKNIKVNQKSNVINHNQFLEMKIIDVYRKFFLNSNYLNDYIFPKISLDHEIKYRTHFIEYLKMISGA